MSVHIPADDYPKEIQKIRFNIVKEGDIAKNACVDFGNRLLSKRIWQIWHGNMTSWGLFIISLWVNDLDS